MIHPRPLASLPHWLPHWLRHWLGLSVAETATELQISEGTVKSRTSRALASLRGVLATDAAPRP